MTGEVVNAVAELLELLLPYLDLTITGGRLASDLEQIDAEVREYTAWTGDAGFIVYVPIGQDPLGGGLIYDGIRKKAGGSTPAEALASSIGKNLEKQLPAHLSDDHTLYLWYDGERAGWRIIPPEFVQSLQQEALRTYNDAALMAALTEKRQNDVFQHAVDVLLAKSSDDEQRTMILTTRQRIREYVEREEEIDRVLADALAEAAKAAEFHQRLETLGLIIQIGTFIAEAQRTMPSLGADAGDDLLTLKEKTREYKSEKDGVVLHYRSELRVQKRLTAEEKAKLKPLLRGAGAPEEAWRP